MQDADSSKPRRRNDFYVGMPYHSVRGILWQMVNLDHVILGVLNLEEARICFQKKTGILPTLGGQHPTLGTHNALVSLGEGYYFELLAKDPSLVVKENPTLLQLQELSTPSFIGWALRCHEFSEVNDLLKPFQLTFSPMG